MIKYRALQYLAALVAMILMDLGRLPFWHALAIGFLVGIYTGSEAYFAVWKEQRTTNHLAINYPISTETFEKIRMLVKEDQETKSKDSLS